MDLNKLTQLQIASLLLADPRTVRRYQKEDPPIPSHGKGANLYFVWAEVFEWRDRRKHEGLYVKAAYKRPDLLDEKVERGLLARTKREMAEIGLAISLGEVRTLDEFSQAMEGMIAPARINLLAIPSRLRASIGIEAAARVNEEITRALRSLGGIKVQSKNK